MDSKRVVILVGGLTLLVLLLYTISVCFPSTDTPTLSSTLVNLPSLSRSTPKPLLCKQSPFLLSRWPIFGVVLLMVLSVIIVILVFVFREKSSAVKQEEDSASIDEHEGEVEEKEHFGKVAFIAIPIILLLLVVSSIIYTVTKSKTTLPTNHGPITVDTPSSALFPHWQKSPFESYTTVVERRLIMLALWSTRLLHKNPHLAYDHEGLAQMTADYPKFPIKVDKNIEKVQPNLRQKKTFSGIISVRRFAGEEQLGLIDKLAGELIKAIADEGMTFEDYNDLRVACGDIKSHQGRTALDINKILDFYRLHRYR